MKDRLLSHNGREVMAFDKLQLWYPVLKELSCGVMTKTEGGQFEIMIDGFLYTMVVEKITDYTDYDKMEEKSVSFLFSVYGSGDKENNPTLGFYILFSQRLDGSVIATTDIVKSESPRHNLKMVGRELYKKGLDFIKHETNKRRVDIFHRVIRSSSLPDEKWEEIFEPMLMDYKKEFDKMSNIMVYTKLYTCIKSKED